MLFYTTATVMICCTSLKKSELENRGYQEMAREILGDSLQFDFNEDSSLVLCQQIRHDSKVPPVYQVRYCVIEVATEKLLHRAHLANGAVSWYGPAQLTIRNFKAYPTVNNESSFIYDLYDKRRYRQSPNHREKDNGGLRSNL